MQIIYTKKVQIQRSGLDVAMLMKEIMTSRNDADREHVWSIGLNAQNPNLTLYVDQLSVGSLNKTISHPLDPRRVFHTALQRGAASIIICQNRLSDDFRPSQEDIFLTNRLSRGGGILYISVLDHVIFNDTRIFSFREYGLHGPLYVYKNNLTNRIATEKHLVGKITNSIEGGRS